MSLLIVGVLRLPFSEHCVLRERNVCVYGIIFFLLVDCHTPGAIEIYWDQPGLHVGVADNACIGF